MADYTVDVAIIGAGTSGMRAYREAAKVTDSVLLIEGNQYGTTCARVGCMPSKLLIAAAEAAHLGRHTQPFGVRYDAPEIDGTAVMKRLKSERNRFAEFVVDSVESWPAHQRVKARATFVSDHELKLSTGETVRADRVVIATGSRPVIHPSFDVFGDRVVLNDDVFEWDTLPESVVVFGAGVIGLEIGQALHRLGVRVSLFGRDDLVGPLSDPDVAQAARAAFAQEFPFYPDADVTHMGRTKNGVDVTHTLNGRSQTEQFSYALIATGRRPNVDRIGLQNTSLQLDKRGVPVFDIHSGRCGDSAIFISGDANNDRPLLHEAAHEGYVAGFNAAHFPDVRRFARKPMIAAVFSDPQIMMVGDTYRDLTAQGRPFVTGAVDWADQGRARVMGVNRGRLHVYGDPETGRFLGAEMVGPEAEHLAHLLAWALQSNLTVAEMLERPFYHPVIEEGLRTALQHLNAALGMGPVRPAQCLDCGVGV